MTDSDFVLSMAHKKLMIQWYPINKYSSIRLSKIFLMRAWMEDNQSVCTVYLWVFVKKGTYNGK